MKEHNWEVETIECSLDTVDFWICRNCGCSGGPTGGQENKISDWIFVAGVPIQGGVLPKDCDEARKLIDTFVEKYPEYKERIDRERGK